MTACQCARPASVVAATVSRAALSAYANSARRLSAISVDHRRAHAVTTASGNVRAKRSLRIPRTAIAHVDADAWLTWSTIYCRTVAISGCSGIEATGNPWLARPAIRAVSSPKNAEHCHRGRSQTFVKHPLTAPIGEVLVGQINGMGFFEK